MATQTLLDIVSLQNNDFATGLIEDVTTYAPEIASIPVMVRPGVTYKIVQRTTLPTAGFRQINQGLTSAKSVYKQQVKEMFPVDCQIVVDDLLVQADDRSVGDILTNELQGALQSTVNMLGSQVYYGAVNDGTNGFVGVRAQMVSTGSVGGTTNSTTAYALWLNPQGVSFDLGRNGAIQASSPTLQLVAAPSGTGNIKAWVGNVSFWIGLSVKSNYSVYGVTGITKHITSSSYDQALTDKAAAALVSTIPLTRRNGLTWFMNRTARFTLQQARSAINYQVAGAASATPAWSPTPTTLEDKPIVVTDSITDTENNT